MRDLSKDSEPRWALGLLEACLSYAALRVDDEELVPLTVL